MNERQCQFGRASLQEVPCNFIADAGERFCPRHKLEHATAIRLKPIFFTDSIVPRPTAEADDAMGVPKDWREQHHD